MLINIKNNSSLLDPHTTILLASRTHRLTSLFTQYKLILPNTVTCNTNLTKSTWQIMIIIQIHEWRRRWHENGSNTLCAVRLCVPFSGSYILSRSHRRRRANNFGISVVKLGSGFCCHSWKRTYRDRILKHTPFSQSWYAEMSIPINTIITLLVDR